MPFRKPTKMAVKTSISATATVKLVGATEEFSESESEEEQITEERHATHENRETVIASDQKPRDIPEVIGDISTKTNPESDKEIKNDIEDPGGTKMSENVVGSSSPRRFNPFDKESFEDDRLQFPQSMPSQVQDSPDSKHSGILYKAKLFTISFNSNHY